MDRNLPVGPTTARPWNWTPCRPPTWGRATRPSMILLTDGARVLHLRATGRALLPSAPASRPTADGRGRGGRRECGGGGVDLGYRRASGDRTERWSRSTTSGRRRRGPERFIAATIWEPRGHGRPARWLGRGRGGEHGEPACSLHKPVQERSPSTRGVGALGGPGCGLRGI